MKRMIFALLLLLAPVCALAQGDQGNYAPYDASTFGFKVDLPQDGTLATPGSADWDREEEVAFEWYGEENAPVKLIMGRVDDAGTELDEASFRAFTDELLSYWASAEPVAEEEDAKAKPAAAKPFEVRNTADNLTIAGRKWNLIEVTDRSDKSTTVYYSVFSTFAGSKIYTITLYYLQPNMEQVQNFGKPVLQSFTVTGGGANS